MSSTGNSEHPHDVQFLNIMAAHDEILRRYVAKAVRHDADAASSLMAAIRARAWFDCASLIGSSDPRQVLIGHAREVCRVWVYTQRHELRLDDRKDLDRAVSERRGWLASPARGTMSVERAVEQREWVERLLGQLTEHQRIAVDFRFRWGMPTSFIATLLDVTESTVRVHLFLWSQETAVDRSERAVPSSGRIGRGVMPLRGHGVRRVQRSSNPQFDCVPLNSVGIVLPLG